MKWNSGLISRAEYDRVCAERQRNIQQLRQELETLNNIAAGNSGTENHAFVQLVQSVDDMQLTRELLDTLVQAVRIYDNGKIEVEWKTQAVYLKANDALNGAGEVCI